MNQEKGRRSYDPATPKNDDIHPQHKPAPQPAAAGGRVMSNPEWHRLPRDLVAKMRRVATAEGLSLSGFVRQAARWGVRRGQTHAVDLRPVEHLHIRWERELLRDVERLAGVEGRDAWLAAAVDWAIQFRREVAA